jgi:hypothetical protein
MPPIIKANSVRNAEAVEKLRTQVASLGDWLARFKEGQPDWQVLVSSLGLNPDKADGLVASLKRLALLPCGEIEAMADLLIFQYVRLPAIREELQKTGDSLGISLCDLFELFTKMILQGFSLFPQNPVQLAQHVQKALISAQENRDSLIPLLELLIDPMTGQPLHGFNAVDIEDPKFVIQCEQDRRKGIHEGSWKNRFKFAQFEQNVRENPQFRSDWEAIKRRFTVDSFRDADGIIRRSKLEEGSWRRPIDSNLADPQNRFQVVFDFFCWKWFLYAMQGDEPMVQKLACNLTPYGTLIFIPGYWNLDPNRDIIWKQVVRLHRARGLEKQGQKLESNRKERRNLLKKLLQANQEAQKQKLRGKNRYSFLKLKAGFIAETDDAHIRRLLRQAKQI